MTGTRVHCRGKAEVGGHKPESAVQQVSFIPDRDPVPDPDADQEQHHAQIRADEFVPRLLKTPSPNKPDEIVNAGIEFEESEIQS